MNPLQLPLLTLRSRCAFHGCVLWCMVIGGFLLPACDRTDQVVQSSRATGEVPTGQLISTSQSPRAALEACIAAYENLTQYQDAGFVRLLYRLDGQPVEDRAPLSVAWKNTGQLGFSVYSLKAGPSGSRWRLRFGDEQTAQDEQILSRALPRQVTLSWLLDDPLVSDRLSAGLAGFPPQLDLLLGTEPLASLVDDSAQLILRTPQVVDGRPCQVLSIQRGKVEYVMWIDQDSHLLRRLRIPNENLAPAMLADQRVSEIQLTIELPDIRTSGDIDWANFTPEINARDRLVTHFVPRPPAIDTTLLDRELPPFTMQNEEGQVVVQSSTMNRDRKILVMTWLADHPACRVAASQLSVIAQQLRSSAPEVAERIQFVCIWAAPTPPAGLTFPELRKSWDMPGIFAVDRKAMGRDLFRVNEAPTLVVLDANNRLQLRELRTNPVLDQLLPRLLAQIVSGENIAQAVVQRAHAEQLRYAVELQLASASDNPRVNDSIPESYQPAQVHLAEVSQQDSTSESTATTVDANQMVWQLHGDGRLERQSIVGDAATSFTTPWKTVAGAMPRIQVSQDTRYIALAERDTNHLEIFDSQSEQNRKIELPLNSTIVDLRWLAMHGTRSPRLAVVTRDAKTILLDPKNREQLSGDSAVKPAAIISHASADSLVEGYVVLENGKVEPLQLSRDSTESAPALPGRPIAHTRTSAPPMNGTAGAAAVQAELDFLPAAGPWLPARDVRSGSVLARGWLAAEEPALFLLDQSLTPRWHYRMPIIDTSNAWPMIAEGLDPASGQTVWGIVEDQRTVHLLRADGIGRDHFRVSEPITGIAIVPSGDRLILRIVHRSKAINYSMSW
ncbi:TlpA family protein disulfide reductase [Aureliella helgolandensis]|uniref:Thioredoxin domain-containing protein n=1 Tax=Aureliella helgolandensis TaxID=2527968 RepID=A0A518G189_9BACT|nr:hypothetical protein [Aureliella helgolandensis]QDV22369.1 hypothetical protein Q31a_06530 [Aureliella helgolandensis]